MLNQWTTGEGCESLLSDHIFVVAVRAAMDSDLQTEKPAPNKYIEHFFFNFRWLIQVRFLYMPVIAHIKDEGWNVQMLLPRISAWHKEVPKVEPLGFRP